MSQWTSDRRHRVNGSFVVGMIIFSYCIVGILCLSILAISLPNALKNFALAKNMSFFYVVIMVVAGVVVLVVNGVTFRILSRGVPRLVCANFTQFRTVTMIRSAIKRLTYQYLCSTALRVSRGVGLFPGDYFDSL